MRFRILGQYVQVSIVALALIESVIVVAVLCLAAVLRTHIGYNATGVRIDASFRELWPRAVLFSTLMVVSLLAFGLYSARQRAQTSGIVIRLGAAMLAGGTLTV